MIKNLPPTWQYPFIADTNIVNTSGVLPAIRNSYSFRFGTILGEKSDFTATSDDIFVQNIIKNSPKESLEEFDLIAKYVGEDMITDATVDEAKQYFQFGKNPRFFFENSEKLASFYSESPQPLHHLAHLMQFDYTDKHVENLILGWWFDLSFKQKNTVLEILKQHAGWGILLPSQIMVKYVLSSKTEFFKFFLKISQDDEKFSKRNSSFLIFFPFVLKVKISNRELHDIVHFLQDSDDVEQLAKILSKKFVAADEYLNLVAQLNYMAVDNFKNADRFEDFIKTTSQTFFALQPTIDQIIDLLDKVRPTQSLAFLLKQIHLYAATSKIDKKRLDYELEPYFLPSEFKLGKTTFHGCESFFDN